MDVNLEAVMGNQLWMVTLNGGFHGTSTWNGGFSIADGWSGRKKKLTTSLRLEWWLNGFCANSPLKWPKEKKNRPYIYGLILMQASELWWFTQIHVDWCWLFWSNDIYIDTLWMEETLHQLIVSFSMFFPMIDRISTCFNMFQPSKVVYRISQPSALAEAKLSPDVPQKVAQKLLKTRQDRTPRWLRRGFTTGDSSNRKWIISPVAMLPSGYLTMENHHAMNR